MDIEILYLTDDNEWFVLERSSSSDEDGIYVTFDLVEDYNPNFILQDLPPELVGDPGDVLIADATPTYSYFVYYGNLELTDSPRRYVVFPGENEPPATVTFPNSDYVLGEYEENHYPLSVDPDSGRISFTRPGQDWSSGFSTTKDARATFRFRGTAVRVVSDTGPQMGKLEARINSNPWEVVDLFSSVDAEDVVVYEKEIEYEGPTELQLQVQTHEKLVNIRSVDFRKYVIVSDVIEEIDDSLVWSTFTGGV